MKTTAALEALKAERQRLDAVVAAAIAQRDEWIRSIGDAIGSISTNHTKRRHMSAAGRARIAEAAKKRWAEKNAAKK